MNISLNFGWAFRPGRIEEAIKDALSGPKVMIPHCATNNPAQYMDERAYQGDFTYQLIFDCKDPSPVKKILFEGVMLQFDAYLNGTNLGHFISGFLPVTIDISEHVRSRGNVLTLFVDGREDPTIPPFGKVVDYITFAGIYRPVTLLCLPKDHILDTFVQANSSGKIRVKTEGTGEVRPIYTLYNKEDKPIATFQDKTYTLSKPHLWSIQDPYLYTLEVRYRNDSRRIPFGFRDAMFLNDGFYLNGKKTKLIGLNRHQTFPYFGPAAPKGLQVEDADLLKRSGINCVRTSHYPQSEDFLRRCDQIGLLVLDEIPGWQYIGQDEAWRNNCRDFCRRMIIKERSHPCLIAYGLRIDESGDDDELYSSLFQIKNELDSRRCALGVCNFKNANVHAEVYAYNDFSCEDLTHGVDPSSQIKRKKEQALLISESNGHMFPTKSFDPTDRRAEHALRHALVLESALADDGYCGAITWCAFDYNTHKDFGSNDHICHHGVYDIFRNPKYAASFFQSQQERVPVLEVASMMEPGDFNAALLPSPRVFTNADYIELYRGDKKVKRFDPDYEHYPHLKHPPIVVDDIIGDIFDEPNISKEDGKKIVATFNYCAQNGYNKLRLRDKLLLARMMAKYHLNFTYVYNAYAKYVQSWGEGSILWRFVAYKDGKVMATLTRSASTSFHLETQYARDTLLHGDTYDCVGVHLFKKDEFGTTMPYASDVVQVETQGPIEVYGPKAFSLYGGASTVYVRSLPLKGPAEGILKITCMGETTEVRFLVRPEK